MFLEIAKAVNAVAGASEQVQTGLAGKIAGFFEYLIGQIPSWIAAFIVFILSIGIAKLAKSAVESRIESQIDEEHQEVMVLTGRVTYFGTLVVGITVALKIAGLDLTTILAAVAFGIGFALQDLIMNFLAGVLILVSRQFTIGDFITVGSTTGKVMEIQSRATILKTYDGTKVIVPNSEIFKTQVTSLTTNATRRLKMPLYISYDTDIKYAIKVAISIMKRHPRVLRKPLPSVIVNDYGDSTIDLQARCWVGSRDGWFKIRSDLMRQLWNGFVKAGIVVPYNITHVETAADSAEYEKEAGEIAKKKMEEMKVSKMIADDAKNQTQNAAAQPAAGAVPTAVAGQPSEQPPANQQPIAVTAVPASVTAEVPISPPGEYADQTEIDAMG